MHNVVRIPLFAVASIALVAAQALFAQTHESIVKKQMAEKQAVEKMAAEKAQTMVIESMEKVRNMTFDFVAGEAIGGKTVKNAPYSAEAVTETVQTLGDGNRIVNRSSSTLYRDSEGRERREQMLDNIGSLHAEAPVKTVSIWDPVAKTNYSLDERKHTARKSSAGGFTFATPGARAGMSEPMVSTWTHTGPNDVTVMRSPMPRVAGGESHVMIYENTITTRVSNDSKDNARLKNEDLGERMIEGVKAKGSRTTHTISAGEMGNERPIEVVSERWYSDELQTVVMTKRSDPRTGETTYKLLNVNRSEPMKSLFEVPADYTVIDNTNKMRSTPMEIRMKKPEEIFE